MSSSHTFFHSVGNNHPNWLINVFQRGRYTTNQPFRCQCHHPKCYSLHPIILRMMRRSRANRRFGGPAWPLGVWSRGNIEKNVEKPCFPVRKMMYKWWVRLVVWNMFFYFCIQLGISSSQLTFTHIFQRGRYTTNQIMLVCRVLRWIVTAVDRKSLGTVAAVSFGMRCDRLLIGLIMVKWAQRTVWKCLDSP